MRVNVFQLGRVTQCAQGCHWVAEGFGHWNRNLRQQHKVNHIFQRHALHAQARWKMNQKDLGLVMVSHHSQR